MGDYSSTPLDTSREGRLTPNVIGYFLPPEILDGHDSEEKTAGLVAGAGGTHLLLSRSGGAGCPAATGVRVLGMHAATAD